MDKTPLPSKPKGHPRYHSFLKGEILGCWRLLEDRSINSYHVKAICTICNSTIKNVQYSVLRKQASKSCGCLGKVRDKVPLGLVHNNFEVVSHKKHPTIEIKCIKCESIKDIDQNRFLKRSKILCNTCGTKKSNITPHTTRNYLTFLSFCSNNIRNIQCSCICGNQVEVDYVAFLNGSTQSCGCKTQQLKKQTNLQTYGVEFYSQTAMFQQNKELIKQKARETKLSNNNVIQLSNGKFLVDLCKENAVPPPYVIRLYHQQGEASALEYISSYAGSANNLENMMINLLIKEFPNLVHYNKFPLEARQLKARPDLRLERNGKILYVNVDGLYWHSELQKDTKYHLLLRERFHANNLAIFQFRENEIKTKPAIVQSVIYNYFGIFNEKYDARKCTVRPVSPQEAKKFFSNNHLMNHYTISTSFGLYYNNELVSCMSITNRKQGLEIARFASKCFTSVRGGFSKLLSHIKSIYNPKVIISFCDLRYATGKAYEITGFKEKSTSLGWSWTDFEQTYNRLECRAGMDKRGLSQAEHARELGWYKIYDAGQIKYIKEQ